MSIASEDSDRILDFFASLPVPGVSTVLPDDNFRFFEDGPEVNAGLDAAEDLSFSDCFSVAVVVGGGGGLEAAEFDPPPSLSVLDEASSATETVGDSSVSKTSGW